MEWFAEVLSALGALVLSLACGLLFEELVFGVLTRLFFAPQSVFGRRSHQERN
jgi:hypothetical protein